MVEHDADGKLARTEVSEKVISSTAVVPVTSELPSTLVCHLYWCSGSGMIEFLFPAYSCQLKRQCQRLCLAFGQSLSCAF